MANRSLVNMNQQTPVCFFLFQERLNQLQIHGEVIDT